MSKTDAIDFQSDSDSFSDDEELIYLSDDEFQQNLPSLFNSSSRRKKSIDNYVAPINLRNKVYRCQEYPRGVFIDEFGEVCPNDKRSGLFRPNSERPEYTTSDQVPHDEPEFVAETDDDEEDDDEEEDYGEGEEDYGEEEEEEEGDDDDDESFVVSDNEEDEDQYEEEEEYYDKESTNNTDEKNEQEHQVTEEKAEEEEEEDLNREIDDLRENNDSMLHYFDNHEKSRKRILRIQKLCRVIEDHIDVWNSVRKTKPNNSRVVISLDSDLHSRENPYCKFIFNFPKKKKNKVSADFLIDEEIIKCHQCEMTFSNMASLYEHVLFHLRELYPENENTLKRKISFEQETEKKPKN
jgi:hypothetical protein